MDTLFEEVVGEVKGLAFHILRQANAAGAGFGGVGEDPHGVDEGRHDLLGTGDPVPIFADRLEGVVGGDGQAAALLQLLEHRIRLAGGEGIRREYQQGDIVDGSRSTGHHHVGGAGAHGGRAGDNPLAVALLGKGDGGVAHALLVAALHHLQAAGVGVQGLAQAHGDAMAEDGEEALYELGLHTVHGHILVVKEFHDCLGCGHSRCFGHYG